MSLSCPSLSADENKAGAGRGMLSYVILPNTGKIYPFVNDREFFLVLVVGYFRWIFTRGRNPNFQLGNVPTEGETTTRSC